MRCLYNVQGKDAWFCIFVLFRIYKLFVIECLCFVNILYIMMFVRNRRDRLAWFVRVFWPSWCSLYICLNIIVSRVNVNVWRVFLWWEEVFPGFLCPVDVFWILWICFLCVSLAEGVFFWIHFPVTWGNVCLAFIKFS